MTTNKLGRYKSDYNSINGFADAVWNLPIPWVVDSDQKDFSASIEHKLLSKNTLAAVTFSPCECYRPETKPDDDAPHLCLTLQMEGVQQMAWDESRESLMSGEVILWDSRKSMSLKNWNLASAYNFWFPLDQMERRIGDVGMIIGHKLKYSDPRVKILSSFMQSVYAEIDRLPELAQNRIMDSAIDLMFSCLHPKVDEITFVGSKSASRKNELHREAQQYISTHEDLSEISPAEVASYLGISTRYLQYLFTEAGMTFSSCVGKVRLERARSALVSSSFRSCSITEIAHRFGFFDGSHFNKSFKQVYGLTPSQYRKSN